MAQGEVSRLLRAVALLAVYVTVVPNGAVAFAPGFLGPLGGVLVGKGPIPGDKVGKSFRCGASFGACNSKEKLEMVYAKSKSDHSGSDRSGSS